MNHFINIGFFIFEFIAGIAIGKYGTLFILNHIPNSDLNSSIVLAFVLVSLFSLVGIGITGYLHSRIIKSNNYIIAMGKAAVGILIGLVFGGFLSALTFDFLPYRISSYYIPILIPILCGVIGFHKGIKNVRQQRI